MSDKYRLIKLLRDFCFDGASCEDIAEFLSDKGVIVPPCDINDPVYFVGKYTGQIVKAYVTGIQKTQHDMFIFVDSGCFFSVNQQLGKSAFRTEEEAKKFLEKESQK